MRSLYVRLPDSALEVLCVEARRELRTPKEQAAFLILEGLRRTGALREEPSVQAAAATLGLGTAAIGGI